MEQGTGCQSTDMWLSECLDCHIMGKHKLSMNYCNSQSTYLWSNSLFLKLLRNEKNKFKVHTISATTVSGHFLFCFRTFWRNNEARLFNCNTQSKRKCWSATVSIATQKVWTTQYWILIHGFLSWCFGIFSASNSNDMRVRESGTDSADNEIKENEEYRLWVC